MKATVTKKFKFEAAHKMLNTEEKCKNIHGHSFRLEVSVEGEIKKDGVVVMSNDIKRIVKKLVIEELDHSYLNEKFEFNPSGENIALWIWEKLVPELPEGCGLKKIVLHLTDTTSVAIEKE